MSFMKRRSVVAIVSALAVAGLAAATALATVGGSRDTQKSVLFVNPLPKYPQWALIGKCFQQQAAARGWKFTETGPTGPLNPTVMLQQVQQGIADKYNAIVTFPASPSFGPVLEQARKANIIVGTMYGANASGVDFNTGADWAALGQQYAGALAGRKGPQHVGLVAVSPTGTGKAWVDGFESAAKKTPNITVSGVVYTGDDPAKTLDQVTAMLTAHPEINVIASHMGTATTPTVSVIKQKKLVGKVIMLANGGAGGGIDGAKAGVVSRFLLQNLCQEGKDAANAAADLGAGKRITKQFDVKTIMASLANYKKYMAEGWM